MAALVQSSARRVEGDQDDQRRAGGGHEAYEGYAEPAAKVGKIGPKVIS